MTKNRIVKYATNTALLAVLAAAGIGAYQLGTSKPEENIQEEQEFVEMEQSTEEEPMVDVGTTEVEAGYGKCIRRSGRNRNGRRS